MIRAIPTEEQEQMALIQWCRMRGDPFDKCFAIPNGGHRHKATAGRLKASGVKAGVPDLFWPVARNGYHGLFIEMKRLKGGGVSESQKAMIASLKSEGYRVEICAGFEAAKAVLEIYFSPDNRRKERGNEIHLRNMQVLLVRA